MDETATVSGVDPAALTAAAEVLGTTTNPDTVNAALRALVSRSVQETTFLLSSPANARRLSESIHQAQRGPGPLEGVADHG